MRSLARSLSRCTLALLALSCGATLAPAQATAPPPDPTRAELVRGLGFIRAAETQQLKAISEYDSSATRVVVRVDTLRVQLPAPPPDTVRVIVLRVDTLWRDRPGPVPPTPTDPVPMPTSSVALPRAFVDITMPTRTGRILRVPRGASLQAALDSAQRGDEVVMDAGATYTGAFTLREKSGTGWIVVRTSGTLPAPGTRVRPADSVHMARLVSPGANQPVIRTALGARGWRLIGLHVTAAPGTTVGALVSINGHEAKGADDQPRQIILDRMLVRGREDQSFQRCVLGGGAEIAVVDSWFDECHGKGLDSQAFVAWQGSGPYLIQNNHLAGAGENVMFGGSDSRSAELLPSDITIRGNHFTKPLAWKGVWTVKNLLEFKVGRRVLVENNVLENSWPDGQTGTAIVAKTSNQSGTAPWSETSDVTIVGNLVLNATSGLNLAGKPEVHPAVAASRFHIAGNVFESGGRHVLVQGVDGVTMMRNTFADGSHGVLFTGTQRGFVATANLFGTTSYGVTADAKGYGSPALEIAAPGYVWEGNAMASGSRNTTIPTSTLIYRAGEALPPGVGATLDVAQMLRRVVGDP